MTTRKSAGAGTGTKRTTPLDVQLCFAVYAAHNAMVRAYKPLLQPLGLTYTQYLVMLVLWHEPVPTTSQVASMLEVQPHALTPVVDKLIASGLVERRPDDTDRRKTELVLTPDGRALEARVADVQRDVACQTQLPADVRTTLQTSLRQLSAHMGG